MTLNGHYALDYITHAFQSLPVQLEGKQTYTDYRKIYCSPVTPDSGNIRFIRREVSMKSGQKRQFSVLSANSEIKPTRIFGIM